MYFFRGSKSNEVENGGVVSTPKAKHKSVDNLFANFLARSISKRNIASPERVPRRIANEFDTPSILSRNRSNVRGLESVADRLVRSRSTARRSSDEAAETKSSRSKSTSKRNDWFGGGGDGGSSRSKSTAPVRNDAAGVVNDGGGSSRSRSISNSSTSRRSDHNNYVTDDSGGGSSRSKSTARRSSNDDGGGPSSRSKSTTRRSDDSRSRSTTRRSGDAADLSGGGGSSSSRSRSTTRRPEPQETLSRSTSRRSTIPIMFSNSTGRGKPPPIENTLECTLEELLFGCVKKVVIARDVLASNGLLIQEEETLKIKVRPGWRHGTRVTFEGKGDERPGTVPADVIFSIVEARHKLYMRDGDDLVMSIEIPLVKALTGCNLSIPLLGGEKVSCKIDEVITPGYEKIIKEQGMPTLKDKDSRGDLKIKFHVAFPGDLTQQQRSDLFSLLKDSC
ncbi:hypothetical protein H6P81_010764 [Aristolochia fimbriata]|uniref:Chaperone DnaJ C-terminal domain-containing protein n=1 Tax=Aristolochia fimbriata TaxID=158543 RepID=A0AAV7EQB4_ARIFI|nr:hypothetical protein H6P81_010764 [Aristolochia fimbriata]